MADIIIDKRILDAIKITAGLDDAGLIMVQFFAEGVKARAKWEKQQEDEKKAS